MADTGDIRRVIPEIEKRIRQAMQETVEKTAQYAESQLSKLFKTEGRSLNVNWSPMKEAYLRQKIKKGYSEKILHRTTTLAQSFTSQIREFSAVVGTPVWYAPFHEEGTRKMPARPFMQPVMEHILATDVIKRFFERALKDVSRT